MAPGNACPSCGFINPRAWRACSACGRSLGSSFRPTGVTGVTPAERTQVTGAPEPTVNEAERQTVEEVALADIDEADEGEREPPLIGQADAAAAITAGIDQGVLAGKPTLVALEGPRGSGKTRLLIYASELAANKNGRTRVLYGVCREGGDGPYAPFSRLLLERFGVTPSSSPSSVRAALASQVASALGNDDVVRITETTHLIGHVAGIPFPKSPVLGPLEKDPAQLHQRACQAVARFLEGDSKHRPVLVLLDNMSYAESPAWDIVAALSKVDGPVSVVIAGDRPVMERAASSEPAGGLAVGPIAPLTEDDVQAMLYVLLPNLVRAPEPLVAAVTHRSGGNPAQVRELAFALWEAGLVVQTPEGLEVDLKRLDGSGDLPVQMSDAVRARLERLNDFEQATLHRAALVGEIFWDGSILAQMRADRKPPGSAESPLTIWPDETDREALQLALQHLEQRGFIERLDHSDLPGAIEYSFALEGTREIVAELIDEESRVRRHAAVARWFGLVGQLQREGMAARIAPHLERAGQHGRAGRAYLEAAIHERHSRQPKRALRYIQRALDMIPSDDVVRRIEALHEHGSLCSRVGETEQAIEAFTEMLQHAWKSGARGKGGAALNRIARALTMRGEDEQARAYLDRALVLFRDAGDLRGVAASLDDAAQIDIRAGELERGYAGAREALEIRRAHSDRRGEAVSLTTLAQLEYQRGNVEQAKTYAEQSLEIRTAIADHEGALQSHNILGVFAFEQGDRERAIAQWSGALSQARSMANRRAECFVLNNLGEARSDAGEYDEAIRTLSRALELAEDLQDRRAIVEVKRNLGLAKARRGDDDGLDHLRDAMGAAEAYGSLNLQALANRAIGEGYAQTIFTADGELDRRAEKYLLKATELFEEKGNELEAARTLEKLGHHLLERGETAAAEKRLRDARSYFRRQGFTIDATRVDEAIKRIR